MTQSNLLELVCAVLEDDEEEVRRLLEVGSDPDQVVLTPAPDLGIRPGITARLAASETGNETIRRLIEGARAIDLDPQRFVGRWVLTSYEFVDDGFGDNAPWSDEEPYVGAHLELHDDGTFSGTFFEGSERSGRWTRADTSIQLEDRDDDLFEASMDGLALIESLSDEQTGFRGPATFRYDRAELLRGLPAVGALVPLP